MTPNARAAAPRILVTGASGYVGGRLLARLERRGTPVRCLARDAADLSERAGPATEVVQGDVLDPTTLAPALRGIDTAFYLIHSMGGSGDDDFADTDRRAAGHFARAARAEGVRRIVYLGGLGDEDVALSPHLASRQEVGRILRASGVPVVEFRASIVIGAGSTSFEMLRALVERLPVMVTPKWVSVTAQPISIDDLLDYLEAALDLDGIANGVYEIGGSERVSYGRLMKEYAAMRGLRRVMIPVPVLTPHLSSLWLGLVTPLYARVGRALIESICHETVVRDDRARSSFDLKPVGVREALERALAEEDREFAKAPWPVTKQPAVGSLVEKNRYGGTRLGCRLIDSRQCSVAAPPAAAFAPIRRIGGVSGWYAHDWLWRLRGWIDRLLGGVGMGQGRADPDRLRVGDSVDWWKVEAFEPDRLLRMRAEMKLPGRGWIEFEVLPAPGGSTIRQTAVFDPKGLLGLLYWYTVYPFHAVIFGGMLKGIAHAAGREAEAAPG